MPVEYNGKAYYPEAVKGSEEEPKPCYLCDIYLTQARSRCGIPVCTRCQRTHFPYPNKADVANAAKVEKEPSKGEDPWEGEDTPVMMWDMAPYNGGGN